MFVIFMRLTPFPTTTVLSHGAQGSQIIDTGLQHLPTNPVRRYRVLTPDCNRESLHLPPMLRSSSRPPPAEEGPHPIALLIHHHLQTKLPNLRRQARDHSKFLWHTRQMFQATRENLIQEQQRDIVHFAQAILNLVGLIRLHESARSLAGAIPCPVQWQVKDECSRHNSWAGRR